MKNKNERMNTITRFLAGEMSSEEKASFDQELLENEELANDLAFMMASNWVLRQYSKEDLQDIEQAALKHQHTKKLRLVFITIGVVLIFFLLWWYLMATTSVLNHEARQGEIQANIEQKKEILRTAGSGWKQDLLLYRFDSAFVHMQIALQNYQPQNCPAEDIQYWCGLLLLCDQKKPAEAIPYLECALSKNYETLSSAKLLIVAFLDTKQGANAQKIVQQYPAVRKILPSKALVLLKR